MINYYLSALTFRCSLIAQLVEHSTVNRVVTGSSPVRGASYGEVPKWLKGTLC